MYAFLNSHRWLLVWVVFIFPLGRAGYASTAGTVQGSFTTAFGATLHANMTLTGCNDGNGTQLIVDCSSDMNFGGFIDLSGTVTYADGHTKTSNYGYAGGISHITINPDLGSSPKSVTFATTGIWATHAYDDWGSPGMLAVGNPSATLVAEHAGITLKVINHLQSDPTHTGAVNLHIPNNTFGFAPPVTVGATSTYQFAVEKKDLPFTPTAGFYDRLLVGGGYHDSETQFTRDLSQALCSESYPVVIIEIGTPPLPPPAPPPDPTPNPTTNPNPDPFPTPGPILPPAPLPTPDPIPPSPPLPPPVPIPPTPINDTEIVDAIDNLNKQQAERDAKQLEEDKKNTQAILDALKGSGINMAGTPPSDAGAKAANAANSASALFPHLVGPSTFTRGEMPLLIVQLPRAFGGATFDLNPFKVERFSSICAWHRRACEWLAVILFGLWASREAASYIRGVHAAPQAKGNTIAAGTGGQATALIAAVAITAVVVVALVALLAFALTNFGAGTLLHAVGVDPMDGLLGGSAWMLDQLFPLGAIIAYFGGRLIWHFAAGTAYAIAAALIRFIVP